MPVKKLKIKKDLKRELLEYLEENVNENTHLETITLSGLQEQFKVDNDKLSEIISELEKEDLLNIHDVSFKLFLPANENGDKLHSKLTKDELISFSLAWFTVFSLALLYVSLPYLNFSLPETFQGNTFLSAYSEGIQFAIILSGLAGPIGGAILIGIVRKLKQTQVLTPIVYQQFNSIIKYTLSLLILVGIFLPRLNESIGLNVSDSSVVLLLTSLGLSMAYVQLTKKE